ncbi:Fc.00g075380.m01.CDS01 [Cosmosporella sp. VM-42]
MSTSTPQDRKPPSAGTKVELGRNAPVEQEKVGTVPNESLAAESHREGGAFSANEGIHSESASGPDQKSSLGGSRSEGRSATQQSSSGSGRNESSSEASGPHGKNLKEGGDWDESQAQEGINKALNAEPGSENDPSRLAEHQMQLNKSSAGRDAGPRQGELSKKTAYDALDSETPS